MDIPDKDKYKNQRSTDLNNPKTGLYGNAIPHLKWKYDYNDGGLNNTIGSPNGQNLPAVPVELPGSGYSPNQIAKAYGFDKIPSIGDGRGKTIAIVVALGSTYIQEDLNHFCSVYGIPSTPVQVHYHTYKEPYPDYRVAPSWALETTLDVQWAHAMAPGAKIVVVVAKSTVGWHLFNAVRYAANVVKADVVSMSWGTAGVEADLRAYDHYFTKSGVSYVASSGDEGGVVNYPSSCPNVTAVGGTSLLYDSESNIITSETAWSNGGGGISMYEPIPTYQTGFNTSSFRSTPDLSLVADPYTGVSVYFTNNDTLKPGWYVLGGTSVSAPIMSALLARRASLGNAGITRFNDKAYGVAGTAYSTYFRDITEGSNGQPAHAGYDLATGLGCPIADQIVQIPA
jgi:subtilase family serine protease